ncbi:MAG TPA: hypothetical protein DCM73_14465 [Clostridiales bacterium]|nr:hypothetical protein [Clostridiales bacterium]
MNNIAKKYKRIQVCFNHFGFFSDDRTLFLEPRPSYSPLDLHSSIHEKYDNCCTDKRCLYSLKQKNWIPHMTVASVDRGRRKRRSRFFGKIFHHLRQNSIN